MLFRRAAIRSIAATDGYSNRQAEGNGAVAVMDRETGVGIGRGEFPIAGVD